MIRPGIAAAALVACRGAPIASWSGGDAPTAVVEDRPADWLVLRHDFQISASAPITSDLACTSPDDPLEDHHLPFVGTVGELHLLGLLADTSYDCALTTADGVALWSGAFRTDPLPVGLPALIPSGDPDAASSDDGYVLFNHWKLGREYTEIQRLIIVDGQGRIRWYLPLLDATTGGLAGSLLPSGLVVAGGGQGAPPALYTLDGDVVAQVEPPREPELGGYNHEAQVTPEGWLVSLQTVTDQGPAGGSWEGFRIEAVDPATGELRWSFDSQPWVTDGVLPPPAPDDVDPYHANAVVWAPEDPDGPSVWVSLRGLGELMRIDLVTREIAGFFGPNEGIKLYGADGTEAPDQAWFWGQHGPEFRGDEILLYDNGGKRPGSQQVSRVVRLRRVDATTAQVLWDWTEPGWYEPNFGSVVTMADGHVLVGTGHCGDCDPVGDTAWIAEVDPGTDRAVWRLDFSRDDDSMYRAQPLSGCAVFANRRFCGSAGG
jgi:hypothetical protein